MTIARRLWHALVGLYVAFAWLWVLLAFMSVFQSSDDPVYVVSDRGVDVETMRVQPGYDTVRGAELLPGLHRTPAGRHYRVEHAAGDALKRDDARQHAMVSAAAWRGFAWDVTVFVLLASIPFWPFALSWWRQRHNRSGLRQT
jgi:hypothetical protein